MMTKYTYFYVFVLAFLAPSVMAQEFTLYLTRHAEKQAELKNPNLTQCGQLRAEQLAEMLSLAKINKVYSTSYNRTLETATPMAKKLEIGVKHYSPKSLDKLAIKLLNDKQNALIVGHSNTTPELANFLTGETVERIAENEYQLLFQITINGENRKIRVWKQPLICHN